MTRKDYVAIAEQFTATHQDMMSTTISAFEVWEMLRDGIAAVFAHDNPCFDYGRFINACLNSQIDNGGGSV